MDDEITKDSSQHLDPKPAEKGSVNDKLQEVREHFSYWTGKLTETSVQLSYAVIAANWAAFGSVDQIRKSSWSKVSITLVVGSLGLSVFAAYWMGDLHDKQLDYVDKHRDEFAAKRGKDRYWPYTKGIIFSAWVFRELKAWLPLAAGFSFLMALLSRS